MKLIKGSGWKVHAVASCSDCDFEELDYKTAVSKARAHAKKTGHEVCVETGFVRYYNKKKEKN